MAKFFRGIRQKFINQGKTANYLKYAIGEIVLVVIGILIALQINNWNDERKAAIVDEAQRKEYIRDLYTEMQSNIIDTESRIEGYRKINEAAEYLLKSIEGDCLKVANITRLREAEEKMFSPIVEKRTNVYDEMRVSGKLNKIKDDSLLINLEDYYSRNIEDAMQTQNYLSIRSDLGEFLMEYSPLIEKYNLFNNGYSFKFMEDLYHQEGYIKKTRKIYSMSKLGIKSNLDLKDKARTVIDYMDKHYSDILKAQ